MHDLLCNLKNAKAHPNDTAKHNKVKSTLKNADLQAFWERSALTEPFFKFAEKIDEFPLEDNFPNSFLNKVPA